MLADWLRQRAESTPDQLGLLFVGPANPANLAWSYAELDYLVDLLVARLSSAGVLPGQHVAALLFNDPQQVLLIHALARLGAILIPLNTRLSADELSWQIAQARCAFLVYNAETQDMAAQLRSDSLQLLNLEAMQSRSTSSGDHPGSRPLNSCSTSGWQLDRIQAILFTSGTTGRPKGAQLTFGNHLWSASASAFRLGLNPDDRWLVALPLYHTGGLSVIFRSLIYGTTLVLQKTFQPAAILEAIDAHHISMISLVPTMLHRLLDEPGGDKTLANLRCILLGGSAAALPLLERALQAGLNLAVTYGMTETASQIATATPAQTRRKPGTVGQPLALCRVRIVNESGATLPHDQIGQIAVSGPTLMAGYYPSDETPRPVEFLTGDLGYLDADGDLWVVQRRHDLILSGGENIYPAEVEAALSAHPQIKHACVVGLDHPQWGQQVAAALEPRPGQQIDVDELLAFCRERLAGYKIPRRVLVLGRLPQTETGKVLRSEIIRLFHEQEEKC